jgi:mRNA-degrading endonuclease RelE of RelBE toxin-antitoxin system
MSYELRLTRNAEKDLLGLRGLTEHAITELLALKQDPHAGHPLQGSLRGTRALEFSIKGVAYRAAYAILAEDQVCLVFIVGPHEGFYEKAEQRAKTLRKRMA